jgi:hypothetical protein
MKIKAIKPGSKTEQIVKQAVTIKELYIERDTLKHRES